MIGGATLVFGANAVFGDRIVIVVDWTAAITLALTHHLLRNKTMTARATGIGSTNACLLGQVEGISRRAAGLCPTGALAFALHPGVIFRAALRVSTYTVF
jgi:hypothetical protein